MWNIQKRRAQGLRDAKEPVLAVSKTTIAALPKDPNEKLGLGAADRLDRLHAATSAGPASETGPFENKTGRNAITGGSLFGNLIPHGAAGQGDGGSIHAGPEPTPKPDIELPPIRPGLNPGELADHHQKLADYFNKVAHPGSATTPNTTQLSPDEKTELGPEIDMQPSQ
jgi:hypothetical protein